MSVNTSLTVVYWGFILGDAYYKWLLEPEDKPKKVPHSEGHIHFTPLVFLDLRLFLFMEHVFYYGLHPVSWFILIANVAVTTIEWQFLIRQFYKLSTGKEEPTAPAASSS
ncbi:hypothetical protein FQA47_011621 [Oryzias melastigma]|uniref:TLC domain-containing protein n=1 Tax=Oryzias melastigma TaxID=30732 RepID=A0A834CIB3_ORYME|nr:hypothetical protein FQA47_011621 [Oryzias melastigma]